MAILAFAHHLVFWIRGITSANRVSWHMGTAVLNLTLLAFSFPPCLHVWAFPPEIPHRPSKPPPALTPRYPLSTHRWLDRWGGPSEPLF